MTLKEWEDEAISKIMLVTLDVLLPKISTSDPIARKSEFGCRIHIPQWCPTRSY